MSQPINIEYYVNGVDRVSPDGWEFIGLKADLTKDFAELELTSSVLSFSGADKTLLTNILNNVGYEAAIPVLIVIPSNNAMISDIQEEFVLTTKEGFKITGKPIEFGVQRRFGINRFLKRAEKSWDWVNSKSPINAPTKFPYRIIDPDPLPQIGMLSIQLGSSFIALYDSVIGLANAAAAALGGISGVVESVTQIALALAKSILVGLVLITTSKQLFRMYFPEQKHLWENKVRDLMFHGCKALGYELSSTLLDNNANIGILPVPILDTNNSMLDDLFGNVAYFNGKYPSSLDSTPTFGSFFKAWQEVFKAKILIIGNVLHFESESFYQQNPSSSIKEMFTDQEELINETTFNISDSWFNKVVGWKTDSSDRWTLDKIQGLYAEYRTDYIGSATSDLVDIEGSTNDTWQFSLAKRKNSLSYLDEQAMMFGSVVDGVTAVLAPNNSTSIVNNVISSVGQMVISDQHFNTTKAVYAINGKQPPNFISYIGAKAIYQAHHTHLQVKENFQAFKEMTVPFSVYNFRDLIEAYYTENENLTLLRILGYSWMPTSSELKINFSTFEPQLSKTQTLLIHG